MTWLEAFLWTCAIETPVYALLLRRPLRGWLAAITLGIALQWLTHPAFWALFPESGSYWKAFFLGETLVTAAEGVAASLLLLRFGAEYAFVRGLAASALANALSASIGLLI